MTQRELLRPLGEERTSDRSGFLRNIDLYAYVFYVIYTPTFSVSFLASKFVILSVLAVVFLVHSSLGKQNMFDLLRYRPLKRLLIIMFVLSLFVAVVHIATYPEVSDFIDLRIVQNNILLLMAIHVAVIIHICKRRGFTAESALRILYKLAAFQGLWGLASFVFIPLKDISNWLYELAAGERGFVTISRVYGFMGEFTFVTPIYHGMLAAVAIYFAMNYRFRGLRYVPLIVVAILLNGRTGLAVFAVMVGMTLLGQLLRGRKIGAALGMVGTLVVLLWVAWTLISELSPNTARFLQSFINDTSALFSDGTVQGTYTVLFTDVLILPEDLAILWGTGDDVYQSTGGFRTDVGLTNDLFMGGLIFVVLGYGALAYFLLKNSRPDTILFLALFAGFAIGIFKGQIFIGSPVLFLFVFVVLIHKQMTGGEMTLKIEKGRSRSQGVDGLGARA